MTDLERARELMQEAADACGLYHSGLVGKIAELLAAVRQEERERVLGLLTEWYPAMVAVGQGHSLDYMLSEVRNRAVPEVPTT